MQLVVCSRLLFSQACSRPFHNAGTDSYVTDNLVKGKRKKLTKQIKTSMYLVVCSRPTRKANTDSNNIYNRTYTAPMQLVVGSRPSHKADRGTEFCAVSSMFNSVLQPYSLRTSQSRHRQMRPRMQLFDDSVPTHETGTDFLTVSSLIRALSLCRCKLSKRAGQATKLEKAPTTF